MTEINALIAEERKALMQLMDQGPFQVPSRKLNENLLIATWNIQQFSNNKTQRALQYMADICERFDLIAIQEVKTNLTGLSKLQELLPGNYKILVSDPTGNNERLAFLYDKRSVIPTGLVCEIGFPVSAQTHTGYQLHRMPYCVSFKAGRFDFVIASAHIYYGQSKAEKEQRKIEIDTLAKHIFKRSKTHRTKVFDRDFFVVGDFNIEEYGDQFFAALQSNGFVMPEHMNELKTNFLRDKTFDKIAWVNRPSFRFTGQCNVVPFGEAVFQELEIKERKKKISDHLPLWAEFQINSLELELDQIINKHD